MGSTIIVSQAFSTSTALDLQLSVAIDSSSISPASDLQLSSAVESTLVDTSTTLQLVTDASTGAANLTRLNDFRVDSNVTCSRVVVIDVVVDVVVNVVDDVVVAVATAIALLPVRNSVPPSPAFQQLA